MPAPTPPDAHLLGAAAVVGVLAVGGCGDDPSGTAPAALPANGSAPASVSGTAAEATGELFPDVVAVVPSYDAGSGTWTFEVTMTSPYDGPDRYADGWRVVGPDGTVYGVHTLAHDHAAEQPFTRRQTGVGIPADVTEVTIEGRDRISGFGGRTVTIALQTEDR